MEGTILSNRYLVAEEIGAGGMGCVYRATDLRTGGEVAVKVPHAFLARNPDFVERLRREAQIGASLYSPRIVRVMDLDTHEGVPYLVMEYVPGETLADVLKQRGRLSVDECLTITLEVARAMDAAHAKGIVHRDLKPQNIKLVDGEVKVLDFGIAKREGSSGLTADNTFMGTPEYAAPERVEGVGDIRSDIYSLGVILYQMLAGQLPFDGPTPIAIMNRHREAELPALGPEVPEWAPPIVSRCLEKYPENRYQTPRELVQALRGVLDTSVSPVSRTAAPAADGGTLPRVRDTEHGPAQSAPPAPPSQRSEASGAAVQPAGTPPTDPAPVARRRRPVLYALVPVIALLLAAAAVAAVVASRDGGGDGGATPAPSGGVEAGDRSPVPTRTTSPSAPPTAGPPPLLAAGQQRSLAELPPIALPVDESKCPGVEVVWRLRSIAAEASGRVTIAYAVQVPRVSGVADCRVGINPDKNCRCWALQTRLISGRVEEVLLSGGTGVTDTGADDLYGRDPLPGTWTFDGANLAGTELTLLFFVDNGVLRYRQPLLKN